MRTCQIDDCDRPHYGRGWCKNHYGQARHRGEIESSPRALVARGASLDERLRHHGWDVSVTGCWIWRAGVNPSGYGQLAVGTDRPMIASRAAYLAWVGPIGEGEVVCHRCDNPPCINPAHLFAGTRAANNADAKLKQRIANGTRIGTAKLTDTQVEDIRTTYAAGGVRQRDLAQRYGVTPSLISAIVTRKLWPVPTYPSISPKTPETDADASAAV